MSRAEYVSHLASDSDRRSTACGEPWQGWQAPAEQYPDDIELPPHTDPRSRSEPGGPDRIRQCRACLRVATREPGEPRRPWERVRFEGASLLDLQVVTDPDQAIRTPHGKYICSWPGCPYGNWRADNWRRHVEQQHVRCTCGRWFRDEGVARQHRSSLRRYGLPHDHGRLRRGSPGRLA